MDTEPATPGGSHMSRPWISPSWLFSLEERLAALEPETVKVVGSVESDDQQTSFQIGPRQENAPYLLVTQPEQGKFHLEVCKHRPRKDKTLGLEADLTEQEMVDQLMYAMSRLADDPRLVKLLPLRYLREITEKTEEWQRMSSLIDGIREFFGIIYRYWVLRMSDLDVGLQVGVLDPNRFNGELADIWYCFQTTQQVKRVSVRVWPATIHEGLDCYFDLLFMSKWEQKHADFLGASLRYLSPSTFMGWMNEQWRCFASGLGEEYPEIAKADRRDANTVIDRFIRQRP